MRNLLRCHRGSVAFATVVALVLGCRVVERREYVLEQ